MNNAGIEVEAKPKQRERRQHQLRPLGHERFRGALGGRVAGEVRAMVKEARERYASDAIVPEDELHLLPTCEAFYRGLCGAAADAGDGLKEAKSFISGFSAYLHCVVNFEFHHRRVFYVDESLSWMLLHTNLDIEGRALKLPFAAFALAFQDDDTIALMRAHARRVAAEVTRDGELISGVTLYITRGAMGPDGYDVDFTFLCDLGDGELPFLFGRTLYVRDSDDLDALLMSDSFRAPEALRDREELRTPELLKLVQLGINCVLYAASSAQERQDVLASPVHVARAKVKGLGKKRQARAEGRLASLAVSYSTESVIELAGLIPISRLRELKNVESGQGGHEVMSRFMVRGHWRRAAERWHDQRLRWIEPYWKGPEMATLVQRQYRLML